MGTSLYSLHVPSAFVGRAGSDVNMSHVSPQGLLAAITLMGVEAGDEGARARASCELGFLLYLVTNTMLLGVGEGPRVLKQKP